MLQPSHIPDVRQRNILAIAPFEMDSLEVVDFVTGSIRDRNTKHDAKCDSLCVSSSLDLVSGIDRALMMFEDMDPVLLVRLASALLSYSDGEEEGRFLDFMNRLPKRLDDLGVHQLSRLLFRVYTSRVVSGELKDRLLVEGLKRVVEIAGSGPLPPRVVAKLCVSATRIDDLSLWIFLENQIKFVVNDLESDQLQQIVYSSFTKCSEPVQKSLCEKCILISPISQNEKTYVGLLISLFYSSMHQPYMNQFCQIFRGHFAIPQVGYISLSKLEKSFSNKFTSKQLRTVRNALNTTRVY